MLDYFVILLLLLSMLIGKYLIIFLFCYGRGSVMFHCMCLVIFVSCFSAFVGGQATLRQAFWTWNSTSGEL